VRYSQSTDACMPGLPPPACLYLYKWLSNPGASWLFVEV